MMPDSNMEMCSKQVYSKDSLLAIVNSCCQSASQEEAFLVNRSGEFCLISITPESRFGPEMGEAECSG